MYILQYTPPPYTTRTNTPAEITAAGDQILEAYLVVVETVVMGISSPDMILICCD
jgi:hypothetical protein